MRWIVPLLIAACGGSLDITVPNDAGTSIETCDATGVDGIAIAVVGGNNPLDPLGYPPYAIDGCTLVYVAPGTAPNTAGDLVLQDLSTHTRTVLEPAATSPRRQSISGDMIAWETTNGIAARKTGVTYRLSGFAYPAGEPRAAVDAVVFTAFLQPRGDSDVYVWIPGTQSVPAAIATGPGEQRFADISDTFVAVTDFSEDPTGAFDPNQLSLADIVVFDRATHARTVRHLPGKQAFPMIGRGGRIGYLDWDVIHPEPKLSQWTLRVGDALGDVGSDVNVKGTGTVMTAAPYVRPSVRGAYLEWVDESTGTSTLYRRPLDLSAPSTTTTIAGAELLGPVVGESVTAIAAQTSNGIALHGVAR
jgi:hypothetical protein